MLDERKASILRAVVEGYIETAQPVGSAHVTRHSELEVSSATVRNDMAVLEREGYLVQPHTSAGRVPTDKGYRFFVDHLAPPVLRPQQTQEVKDFFNKAHGELEQMLHDTSRLLSRLTDYASVVVGPPHEAATVRSVQLVPLHARLALLVLVLSNGVLEKRSIELPADASDDDVARASGLLAGALVGSTLAAVPEAARSGDPAVDAISQAAAAALRGNSPDDEGDHVFVGGTARVAGAFDAVETVRQVLDVLERQYVVVTLLRDVMDQGLSVAIGAEHGLEQLAECSLVVAPYTVEGEHGGAIGLLGPTRMNYPQAMAAVAVVSQRLGDRLREG